MGTECSAFGRVVFPLYRSSAVPVGLCLEFTRQVTCSRKVGLTCGPEAQVRSWGAAHGLSAPAATRKTYMRRPFRELQCTRVPDGLWCFPLASEMCLQRAVSSGFPGVSA
ncbi:rCG19984, partial [Rattus norvegicus]